MPYHAIMNDTGAEDSTHELASFLSRHRDRIDACVRQLLREDTDPTLWFIWIAAAPIDGTDRLKVAIRPYHRSEAPQMSFLGVLAQGLCEPAPSGRLWIVARLGQAMARYLIALPGTVAPLS
jgi:hypothetical protein